MDHTSQMHPTAPKPSVAGQIFKIALALIAISQGIAFGVVKYLELENQKFMGRAEKVEAKLLSVKHEQNTSHSKDSRGRNTTYTRNRYYAAVEFTWQESLYNVLLDLSAPPPYLVGNKFEAWVDPANPNDLRTPAMMAPVDATFVRFVCGGVAAFFLFFTIPILIFTSRMAKNPLIQAEIRKMMEERKRAI